jgi:hypothetical protein
MLALLEALPDFAGQTCDPIRYHSTLCRHPLKLKRLLAVGISWTVNQQVIAMLRNFLAELELLNHT